MDSQSIVVFMALIVALVMAFKPEMFILNPDHRTPSFVRSIKYIGMAVSLVFLVWLLISFATGKL